MHLLCIRFNIRLFNIYPSIAETHFAHSIIFEANWEMCASQRSDPHATRKCNFPLGRTSFSSSHSFEFTYICIFGTKFPFISVLCGYTCTVITPKYIFAFCWQKLLLICIQIDYWAAHKSLLSIQHCQVKKKPSPSSLNQTSFNVRTIYTHYAEP